jgi:WXG100 family type VII secretion target
MNFQVETTQLTAVVGKIEKNAEAYQQLYTQLYQAVDAMQGAWSGEDNVAFATQINGFQDDFERMHRLLLDFAALVREAKTEYQTALDNSTAVARNIG